jgi:hypothetical protein
MPMFVWYILYAISILCLVLAMVGTAFYLLGKGLPEEHRASSQIDIERPIGEVFEKVSNIGEYPRWAAGVTGVKRLEDHEGLPTYHQRMGRNSFVLRVTRHEPPARPPTATGGGPAKARFATTISDDRKMFSGSWEFELESRDGQGGIAATRVTLTETGRVPAPVPRAIVKYVMGHDSTVRKFLASLSRAMAG